MIRSRRNIKEFIMRNRPAEIRRAVFYCIFFKSDSLFRSAS